MKNERYPPPKQIGLVLHSILILALAGISAWGFINLSQTAMGPSFVIFLLEGLLALVPLPFFAYRTYALWRADYILDRDSLELRWGLRDEDIPLSDIEWVRPAIDLTVPLRLPWTRIPGAILGLRRHPDMGVVEFMASQVNDLLLVGTAKRVYAISPEDAAKFVETFARIIEMGSLTPAEAKSVYPSFIFSRAWENAAARFLFLLGLFMNVGLLIWVSLSIPAQNQITLGFAPSGAPLPPSPAENLILLPVISTLLFFGGLIAGLYFYRWEDHQVLALIIWTSSALTSLSFLLAVLFIVSTPI